MMKKNIAIKIFGSGSRAGISITFLIKNPLANGGCQIYYHDIGGYLNRKQKLETIKEFGNVRKMGWRTITPNAHHDWINQRDEAFLNYLPLGDKDSKRNKGTVSTVFTLYSSGVKTNRDAWAYNFSKDSLARNMRSTIVFYNEEVDRYRRSCEGKHDEDKPEAKDFINYDSNRIHWDVANKNDLAKNITSNLNSDHIRHGMYRSYCKQWLYFDK